MEPDDKPNPRKFTRIAFYLLSVIVFYFAVSYVGKFNDIKALILQISPLWLTLALSAQLSTYLISAFTLRVLLKNAVGITFFTLFKIAVVIMFINQALPTGGISGNGYTFHQLIRRKIAASTAYNTLITQNLCYYISVAGVLGFLSAHYFVYTDHPDSVVSYTVAFGFFYFTLLGTLIIMISNQRLYRFLIRKLNKYSFISNYLKELKSSSIEQSPSGFVKNMRQNKRSVFAAIFFEMTVILLDIITVYAILKGFNVSLPFAKISFAVILAQVIGAIPISPGSLIAYESAMTYFLNTFGVAVHAALIVTLMFRFLTFWLPIPIGLLLYRNLSRHKHSAAQV